MGILAFEDLTFSYPGADFPALRGVSLTIDEGSYTCLCGQSGCGKTTLLRHLKTALRPHGKRSGQVLFEGRSLDEVDEKDQSALIGFVMQDPDAQIVTDRVWHEVAFGLESLGTAPDIMTLRVAEMAAFFDMESWFQKDINALSGGQKQMVNLASILAMQPRVLVLDEPTAQLDPIAATELLAMVRRVNRELGITILLSEHRLEEVYPDADEVIVMAAGEVTALGSPRDVACRLHGRRDPLASALPAPIRIYYGLADDTSTPPASKGEHCPLTIREGRRWLDAEVRAHPPARTALPLDPSPLPEGQPALSMKGVRFRYERDGSDVLCGVDLQVPPCTTFAIMGGNGSGKTTLLRCACRALKPYGGQVRLFGKRLASYGEAELYGGYVNLLPQDPCSLFAGPTVGIDLAEMARGLPIDGEEREARMAEAVRLCAIEGLLDSHPFDLSRGEQQRVALAMVLLAEPRLLLLDEPTKGMDGAFKEELARIFDGIKAKGGTIVLVSHDLEFCARHADGIALLFDGSIVSVDSPRGFFSGNSFYTTAASRMSRHVLTNAVTDADVIGLCLSR